MMHSCTQVNGIISVTESYLLFLAFEDRLLLKESITDGFSVRHMYRKLMYSLPIDFPCRSIWNPIVPPKLGFFAWEASWGKVLTLDQLERRGIPLVNKCFLCEENEETIDHLLIHCSRAKMLWDLLLAIIDSNWVFPRTVRQLLLVWQSASVGKKRKRVWMTTPLCIFWTLWLERNRVVFENEAPSAHMMKYFFLFTLWSWAKLYSVDNLNSLVGFCLGWGIGESELVLPCTPLVYSLGVLCSFFIYILLFTDKKKIFYFLLSFFFIFLLCFLGYGDVINK